MKTDKAKNDFESVIYAFRDWLYEDENTPFVGDEQKEAMIKTLQENEDWLLEGEGETASYVEYNEKYQELNKKFKQYKMRKEENERRDEVVAQAFLRLASLEQQIGELKEKKPWIPEDVLKDQSDKITELQYWIDEVMGKQKQTPLNEDPAFKVGDLEKKIERLNQSFSKAANTPKPKEEKKKKIPKNIKIDNIKIDGNEGDVNWEDFIKINNGDDNSEESTKQE